MKASQRAYESILNMIQTSEIKDAVVENDLTEILDISRTPVREAIARLIVEGWVEVLENGGKVVCKITVDQAREIFQVRMSLEALLLELAWSEIDREKIAEIKSQCEHVVSNSNYEQMPQIMSDFYQELNSKSNNKLLAENISVLHNKANLIKVELIDQVKRKSVEEIIALLESICSEDQDKAVHHLKFHLAACYYRLFGEL
ncbi:MULTISPECIES: GntR family transcriptional regulator [Vibrio]|uniref:GntR family transcriptional regulator n=1 Tax=Vibrio TaxID=662 RepID=UPI000154172B|nr:MULTISPECIES: GntR family transcriptional regulator [Vibrio]EDL53585.1 hypothetical transcriptional regulator [Vibrio mediterranei AK1]MCY9869749.1 GntR family transcriptional regulator [Vibrio barjaei]OIN27673.1 hypothetical protein AWH66_2009970 [Vibrio barjaei]